jgi:hypothetical protein
MRLKLGQEAIEFVLIGTLIFLTALFSFVIFGKKIAAFFESDSAVVKASTQKANTISTGSEVKYKPDYPTEIISATDPLYSLEYEGYNGTYKNITAGPYTFSVPEDFNTYVKGAGASGGTELFKNMLLQIALELETKGQITEGAEVRRLANLGHNIAAIQRTMEEMYTTCGGAESCIKGYKSVPFVMPADYEPGVFGFPSNSDGTPYSYKDVLCTLDIGTSQVRLDQELSGTSNAFTTRIEKYNHIGENFVTQLNDILDGSTIDSSTKGIIQEIAWNMGTISTEFSANTYLLFDVDKDIVRDPLTGEKVSNPDKIKAVSDYKNYKASTITHLDSSLTCAADNYSDSGTSCH